MASSGMAITKPNLTPAWGRRASEQPRYDLIHHECAHVGERAHVRELNRGPLPAAGLAAHHGHRGHALHREREEDQQSGGAANGEALGQGRLQSDRARIALHAVDRAERSDDDLARGKRTDQAYADLPVESERLDE